LLAETIKEVDTTMRKLKIYLDTSVISHLHQLDAPDKMNDTLALWDKIKTGEFDVVLSYVDFNELAKCSEEKRAILADFLAQIQYTNVDYSEEIFALAGEFIKHGILKQKSFDDAQHIAVAMVLGCDVVVSWNFKHMVNHKTIDGVKIVSAITKYRDVAIYTPTMIVGGDEDDS
jgi:predicted nucleic acid-binding protein